MDTQLYIRARGRVLGPYDEAKLQSLVRRGQLSRLHEVSEDGTAWVRASDYPSLFIANEDAIRTSESEAASLNGQAAQSPTPQSAGAGQQSEPQLQMNIGPESEVPERKWYYNKNGKHHGPLDSAAMQILFATCQLDPDDLVWSAGCAGWMSASNVPEFSRGPGMHSIEHKVEMNDLPPTLCKSAAGSRPWVLFIAITAFVYGVLSVLGGVFLLIVGANVHAAPVVATGLFNIIYGGITCYGGFLLANYASRLSSLIYGNKPIVLEKAMDALRHFWIFASIVMIVMLAFLLFVVVWIVAIGGTLPGAFRDL